MMSQKFRLDGDNIYFFQTMKLNVHLFGGSSIMEGDFHQDLFKSFVAMGWLCTSVLDKAFRRSLQHLFWESLIHVSEGK